MNSSYRLNRETSVQGATICALMFASNVAIANVDDRFIKPIMPNSFELTNRNTAVAALGVTSFSSIAVVASDLDQIYSFFGKLEEDQKEIPDNFAAALHANLWDAL
jgi:hypothetical protein